VPFWTALFSFFPAHAEAAKKKILNLLFPLNISFSTTSTYPRNPALPIPHHTLPPWRRKRKAMPCSGYTGAIPHYHALHLDKVWWTSPPAAYKYRGKEEEWRGFFFFREKREASCRNKKKQRESENRRGEEKQRLRSLHREEEEPSSPPWAPPLFLLLHRHQQHREQLPAEPGKERVGLVLAREERWKEQNTGDEKKNR